MRSYDFGLGILAFSTLRGGAVDPGEQAARSDLAYNGYNQWRGLENRRRLAERLGIGPEDFVIPHQVHSDKVAYVSTPGQPEGVDAVFTDTVGLCVCVSTADCIPLLLYDMRHQAVAAIHAGWRGTVARIVRRTLAEMQATLGTRGSDVRAVISPGISLEAFEVGDEVCDAFQTAGFPMERIAQRREKWHIDLWEANRLQLEEAGVADIQLAGTCTYSHPDLYYSARRLGIKSGRILNGILLKHTTI